MSSRIIALLVTLYFFFRNYGCSKVVAMSTEDLELEREVQSLNKPPVKSIQFEDGIVDCIDIYNQPSLDHPFLKNHKIQLRPTTSPYLQTKKLNLVSEPLEAVLLDPVDCPDGTVPIRRTTKDDLIKAKTYSHWMFPNPNQTNALIPNTHHVNVYLDGSSLLPIKYTGVLGYGTLYNFTLATDQSTSTDVWVDSGPPYYFTRLMAGVMASPPINGDNMLRLFIYYALEGDESGCFNYYCHGFIQVDRAFHPGSGFEYFSTIGADIQDHHFAIFQDQATKNWWLTILTGSVAIGYWPRELVPSLELGAATIGWGGMAMAHNENSPPMGSGQYPDGDYSHVGYFRRIQFMNGGVELRVPTDADPVFEYAGESRCYGLQNDKDTKTDYWGYRFGFGGPGGCGTNNSKLH